MFGDTSCGVSGTERNAVENAPAPGASVVQLDFDPVIAEFDAGDRHHVTDLDGTAFDAQFFAKRFLVDFAVLGEFDALGAQRHDCPRSRAVRDHRAQNLESDVLRNLRTSRDVQHQDCQCGDRSQNGPRLHDK